MKTADTALFAISFYFIRHGQSTANAEGYPAGTLDAKLTRKGQEEAIALRGIIENLPVRPSCIVTSHLARAIETADLLNVHMRLPVEREALLNEQHYGDCQGVHKDILNTQYGPDWSRNPPNGEAFDDFTARILRALETVLTDRKGIPLIVGHGGMPHALGRLYGVNLRGLRNCTFLHFSATDAATPWSVLDHEGAPYETGIANMEPGYP